MKFSCKKKEILQKTETIFLSVGVDWEKKYAQKCKVIEKLNLLNMKSKIIIVGSIYPQCMKFQIMLK